MKVRQLVGRLAGQIVDMPYAEATSCVGCGTAAWPEDTPRVKGLNIPTPAPVAGATPKPAAKKKATPVKKARAR